MPQRNPIQKSLFLAIAVVVLASNFVTGGEVDPQQKSWYDRYKKQENAPKPEDMLLNTDPEPDLQSGFLSLFNGKDLEGWTPKGGESKFEARDGLLVGTCVPGTASTYLSTEQSFKDFVFTCEMKWEVDCNSGVMFRAQSRPSKNGEVVFGPQAEMEGFSKDRHWSGGIYGQSCGGYFYPLWLKDHREARAAAKEGEWNRVTVLASGNTVKTWVNGVPAAHWIDDGSYAEGFFGLQIHKGEKGQVLWRDLRVKQLPPDGDKVSQAKNRKPNVVFLLADDLGWSDTTLYGTTEFYRTPNIARLAERGMTFTRAYSSSPLCSPTRASILTGLSPARHGITSPNCHLPKVVLTATASESGPANRFSTIPNSVSRLDTKYETLAETLRDNGYATGHFGKWHLGPEPFSPLQHGFDVDLPHHAGPGPAGSYVAPWKFRDFDHDPDIPDEHIEDRMAKEAIAFIEQNQDRPFFLNYWMFSVHAPFDAKPGLIEEYRKRMVSESGQTSPTYAAMIESMDDAVGSLLDTLDRLGIAENTIIVFASDNGGNMYNYVDGGTATNNAPLRGGKATMYEGGIRGPAIVVQPDVIEAGIQSNAIIQSSDFYPTLLDLLAIPPQPDQIFDGISIVPALKGSDLERKAIFTYFPHAPNVPDWLPPAVSVHAGSWKLIRIFFGGENGNHRYLLFNLESDIGETHNLAHQYPERVAELDALIERHLRETHAVCPIPNPKFDSDRYDVRLEGKAELKGKPSGRSRNSGPNTPRDGNSSILASWRASKDCLLALKNQSLQIESHGRDPYIVHQLSPPIKTRDLRLLFTMSSNAGGSGQVFWREQGVPRFSASHSQTFQVHHDGQQHTYAIDIRTQKPLVAIRIDPARSNGTIQIGRVQLTNLDDKTVYEWDANDAQHDGS